MRLDTELGMFNLRGRVAKWKLWIAIWKHISIWGTVFLKPQLKLVLLSGRGWCDDDSRAVNQWLWYPSHVSNVCNTINIPLINVHSHVYLSLSYGNMKNLMLRNDVEVKWNTVTVPVIQFHIAFESVVVVTSRHLFEKRINMLYVVRQTTYLFQFQFYFILCFVFLLFVLLWSLWSIVRDVITYGFQVFTLLCIRLLIDLTTWIVFICFRDIHLNLISSLCRRWFIKI